MLIFVGWVPPCLCSSGACLGLGTRVCRSLITLTRVAPSPGLRLPLRIGVAPGSVRVTVETSRPPLRRQRLRVGDRPHERRQLPRDGGRYRVWVLAPG